MAAFVVMFIAAVGVPSPGTLFLLALGSFVQRGEVELRAVILVALTSVVLGDQVGYLIGRVAGRRAVEAFALRYGRAGLLRRAEAFTERWGAPSIFLSRTVLTPLGPWVNMTSGIAAYPWPRFTFWEVSGVVVWVTVYVNLGRLFYDRVEDLAYLQSSLGWVLLGLAVVAVAAWALRRRRRNGTLLDEPVEEHAEEPTGHA